MDATKAEWSWRFGTVDEVTADGIAIRADVYQRGDGRWFAGVLVGTGKAAATVIDTEDEARTWAEGVLVGRLKKVRAGQVPLFGGGS